MGLSKRGVASRDLMLGTVVKFRIEYLLTMFMVAVFVFAIVSSQDWPGGSRLFTLAIAIPGLFLTLLHLVREAVRKPMPSDVSYLSYSDTPIDRSISKPVMRSRTLNIFSWIFGLFILIWLVNFKIAVPLFTFFYIKFQARENLLISFLLTGIMIALIIGVFDLILHVPWPKGVIQSWIGF